MDEEPNIQEHIYALYKATRTFINEVQDVRMTYDEFLFLHDVKQRCDNFDKHNNKEFLKRWLSDSME
jgi:hypothetical protein